MEVAWDTHFLAAIHTAPGIMMGLRIAKATTTTFADADFFNRQSGSRSNHRTISRSMTRFATAQATANRISITEQHVIAAECDRGNYSKSQKFAKRINNHVLNCGLLKPHLWNRNRHWSLEFHPIELL
jgi:hypothetical protein